MLKIRMMEKYNLYNSLNMTTIEARFQRDLTFLSRSDLPKTSTGKEITSLDYKGDESNQLSDSQIQSLSSALKQADSKFRGPLNLKCNTQLTDLSALYISEIFAQRDFSRSHITELNLSETKMQEKAGLFIGEALLQNPLYPLQRLKFKGVNLEESGLYRVLEAVNANKNISRIHLGVISDYGLRTMAELLQGNKSLLRLEFSENEAKPWTKEAKQAFSQMLKGHTELQSVIFKSPFSKSSAKEGKGSGDDEPASSTDPHREFRHEIEFYTNKKLQSHKHHKKFLKRHHDCDPQSMFEGMLELLEAKDSHKKMPVRKFFNNTFGTILNDALFALKKKQSKEPENVEIFTKKGSIKFVALYIMENLPQNEREPDLYNSADSADEV
ncbi:hypothetical protein FGO68_gene9394 [Halteria grandinella]|uniref:Uncharacterized protein n=1 Tax=Halteria grandinella TaxID=5974 RepID=A0A8J8NZN9_HALGN|nr:hypothetical protein FGO68_gene9394 [Halteria grandinella]